MRRLLNQFTPAALIAALSAACEEKGMDEDRYDEYNKAAMRIALIIGSPQLEVNPNK